MRATDNGGVGGRRHTPGIFDRVRISERVDNAIRAIAELAAADGQSMKAEAIGRSQDISFKYLLDILRDLKHAELVRSKRGPDGGFTLARPATEISLADIFRAIDGPLADVHDESLSDLTYPPPASSLPRVLDGRARQPAQRARDRVVADLVAGDLPPSVEALADDYETTTVARHGR